MSTAENRAEYYESPVYLRVVPNELDITQAPDNVIFADGRFRLNKPVLDPSKTENAHSLIVVDKPLASARSTEFSGDFEQIDSINRLLGIGRERFSHNIAYDRARYERAKTRDEKQAVKRGVVVDLEKTLRERAHASQSSAFYYLDNEGNVNNPDFPGEPFDRVLQRGLQNSRRNNYVDYEREVSEFEGWSKVMTSLFDSEAEIGSKQMVISGPSSKSGTSFTDNFVDIYELREDFQTGKKFVVMTRFASGNNFDEYREIVEKFDPNYFDTENEKELFLDAFLLSKPLSVDREKECYEIFEECFKAQKGATKEADVQTYLKKNEQFVNYYAEVVCSPYFNPERVKLAFNAAINKFDQIRKGVVDFVGNIATKGLDLIKDTAKTFRDEVEYLGRQMVEKLMVGCGLSGGFSVAEAGANILGKSLSVIGGLSGGVLKSEWYCKSCPMCGKQINCEVKPGERCPNASCGAVRECT